MPFLGTFSRQLRVLSCRDEVDSEIECTAEESCREDGNWIATPHGPRACFQATADRPGRKPLVTRYGGIPLKRHKKAVITDRLPGLPTRRKELTIRLRARRCEWCDTTASVEIHQVRKLADLTRTGRPQPGWAQLMTRMRRKTLVVCIPCHQAIHHGHPAALTA